MTMGRKEQIDINPEIEEDGESHLTGVLDRDEDYGRMWEAKRGRRELGMLVLEKRLELGLSQRELARRIDTNHNRIYLIENGEATPTLDTLQRVSEELGLTLEIRPRTLAVH